MTVSGQSRWKLLLSLALLLLVIAGVIFLRRTRSSQEMRSTISGALARDRTASSHLGSGAMSAHVSRPMPSSARVAANTAVGQTQNGLPITLAPSGSINGTGVGAVEGVVTDRAGRHIPGVNMRDVISSPRGELARNEGRTDSEGRYRLSGLKPGWIVLKASRDGDDVGASTDVEIQGGATAQADFVLDEIAVLTGHVRSKFGGVPREPIKVTVLSANSIANGMGGLVSGDSASTAVDSEGFYKFVLPAPRDYNVYARFERRRGSFLYETGTIVSLDPGTARNVDLVISEENFHVLVLEPGGDPSYLPLISVVLGGSGHRRATLRAGENGQTELSLPDGYSSSPILVEARNGGRLGSASVPPGANEVTIQLQESASVFGRVTAYGEAVSGFSARVELVNDAFGIPFGPFEFHPELQFDKDSYEFLDVPARHVAVIVNTGTGLVGSREVRLSPGGRAQVDVDLGESGAVVGRVVNTRHAPLQGSIWLDEISNWSDSAPDGSFRLDNVSTGDHQIKVSASGYETIKQRVIIASGQVVDLGEVMLPWSRVASGTIGAMFVSNDGHVSINLIAPDSPASNSGLRVSDVVVAIDGQLITTAMQAERQCNGEPGTTVGITVARDGAQRAFAIARAN